MTTMNALTSRLRLVGGLILLAAGIAVAGGSALAAGPTGNTTASVAVASSITLSGLTSGFTLSGNPNTTQTANGAVSMKVTTNNKAGYSVSVLPSAAALAGAAAGNTDVIPIASLKVRKTGAPTFTPLSNVAPVLVHTQAGKSDHSGDTVSNDYEVDIPFVNSDTYSVALTYTATTL